MSLLAFQKLLKPGLSQILNRPTTFRFRESALQVRAASVVPKKAGGGKGGGAKAKKILDVETVPFLFSIVAQIFVL